MTQRDGTGREVERGSVWGTHVYLWRIHVDVWQNQFIFKKKNTDVYSGLLDSEGEGEGGMIWENGTETCTFI